MSDSGGEYISVIAEREQEEAETHSMFPSPRKVLAGTCRVAVEALGDGLARVVGMLGDVAGRLPDSCGDYHVETLTFSLTVDGEGKVSLVGQVSAGFASGITVTLNRRGG